MRFSEIVSRSLAARIESIIGMKEASASGDTGKQSDLARKQGVTVQSLHLQDMLVSSHSYVATKIG